MSWLDNYVPPKLKAWVGRRDVPDNLWKTCEKCGQMLHHLELKKNVGVCNSCGHHMRIDVETRLQSLFDEGRYVEHPLPETSDDPLKFKDTKKYADRLKDARAKSGVRDCMTVADGKIQGQPAVVAIQDFGFMGGSMGRAMGEAFVKAVDEAVTLNAPLIVFPASGGARMQESILSLMQMARTTAALEKLKDARLPYIVVLTDPTTGGVTASFAMLGDVQIAEPGARIGFAGRRVIEQTVREKLPDDFQTAEFLLDHGMIDMVVARSDMPKTLGRLISLFMNGGESQAAGADASVRVEG